MKILAVSDREFASIYNSRAAERFGHNDLVLSCGDLPIYYLEYMISTLNLPLYYVHGNHWVDGRAESQAAQNEPWGGSDLHRKVLHDRNLDLLIAGIEGSLPYSRGPRQYSQLRMWLFVLGLVPRLLYNRLAYGRYLDIFVSHAPPAGIHDDDDPARRGIHAFRWLLRVFKPRLHLHGHVHIYMPMQPRESRFHATRVVNAYGYYEIELD